MYTHQNHQNHQNMRFDLIHCVQKESIPPFRLRIPYLKKKLNKKIKLLLLIKLCNLIYLERLKVICSSFLVLYSISSVARLMDADKRLWLLYFLTEYSKTAPVSPTRYPAIKWKQ